MKQETLKVVNDVQSCSLGLRRFGTCHFWKPCCCLGSWSERPNHRTINTEVASVGVSLILLTYNSTLALLTLIATTIIVTLILFRAISRLEEIGADV